MNIDTFSSALRDTLYPSFYTDVIDPNGTPFALVLSRPKKFFGSYMLALPGFRRIAPRLSTARYALCVRHCPDSLTPDNALDSVRRDVNNAMKAVWGWRPVGAYVVLCGSARQWRSYENAITPDTTGFHNVILQAFHYVDLDVGESAYSHTSFAYAHGGNLGNIAQSIEGIVRHHTATTAQ